MKVEFYFKKEENRESIVLVFEEQTWNHWCNRQLHTTGYWVHSACGQAINMTTVLGVKLVK